MEDGVVLVRLSQKKGAERDRIFPDPRGRWERFLAVTFTLATAIVLGLTVAALVHGTVTYLVWVVVGVSPWLFCFLLASLMKKPPERDEAVVAAVDRLRERTGEGAFGEPPPGGGPVGWLTREGLYTGSGRLYRWADFADLDWQTGRLKSSGVCVHRLEFGLSDDTSPRVRLWNKGLLPLVGLLMAVGPCLEAWEAALGVRRYGLRDDVLAAIAGAVAALVLLAHSARLLRRRGWRLGRRGAGVLLVDAERFPLRVVRDLVPERLLVSSRNS